MLVTLKIKRFDPDRKPSTWWSTFQLEADGADRVLDLLVRAKDEHDGSLTFRRSCAHGICGSCAVRVNGTNRLAAYRSIKPYLLANDPLPEDGRERRQAPAERMRFDDTTKCILCAACTTACPVFWADGSYLGPAAIVQAHRFMFDSRDQSAALHSAPLAGADGIWRCRTVFQCTLACPRDIKITKAIAEVKGAIVRQSVLQK
jgi:succinate dehydrogenase / fumarate reductase iron-sulfur subunit